MLTEKDNFSPAEAVRHIDFFIMFKNKDKKLFTKVLANQNILKQNTVRKLIVYRVAVPNTDFNSLLKSMVSNDSDLNQP